MRKCDAVVEKEQYFQKLAPGKKFLKKPLYFPESPSQHSRQNVAKNSKHIKKNPSLELIIFNTLSLYCSLFPNVQWSSPMRGNPSRLSSTKVLLHYHLI